MSVHSLTTAIFQTIMIVVDLYNMRKLYSSKITYLLIEERLIIKYLNKYFIIISCYFKVSHF